MNKVEKVVIHCIENDVRLKSRVLEEHIQEAVSRGCRHIEVHAHGQHGIGGRLWPKEKLSLQREVIKIDILGYSGQRVGSMGTPQTRIDVYGNASDDVGWLNAGATIVVHGDASNGAANGMAQGKIYVNGDIGARGMTMTKSNPKFDHPELWILGGAGDSFAEFMAGGIAVVCGFDSGHNYQGSILGDRPCVGMVGGKIFFRGEQKDYSQKDAKLVKITDKDWEWLIRNIKTFLEAINRIELEPILTEDRSQWHLLRALQPFERSDKKLSIREFHSKVWDKELGPGGLIGDLTDIDHSPIPIITTGDLRRYIPSWENHKYLAPCQAGCPTGIPVRERWELIRKNDLEEAAALGLQYTPFPATVCGYLCPNLCMDKCTRKQINLPAINVTLLGQASENAKEPKPVKSSGKKIAIIGAGPAGLSAAWQLWMKGHEPVVFDYSEVPGGKIARAIPESRFPREIFEKELQRVLERIPFKKLPKKIDNNLFFEIRDNHSFMIIAVGADLSRKPNIPGSDKAIGALDFLRKAKDPNIKSDIEPDIESDINSDIKSDVKSDIKLGKKVLIIGAGNVGCDVATEAHRLGAKEITLIDIQKPASFGKEREAAERIGAQFLWPVIPKAIHAEGLEKADGDMLKADTVIVAIGDIPDLSFLPETIQSKNGYILVDDLNQTADSNVYAIGDAVRPGLLTDAIADGRKVSKIIDARLRGLDQSFDHLPVIDYQRIKLEYYNPLLNQANSANTGNDLNLSATTCASCGGCRDCGICMSICPNQAISRKELQQAYEYLVDDEKCIGCGFCAGACPCGIWELETID